jgi:nucleoside 2-deoxyribosyltransferase
MFSEAERCFNLALTQQLEAHMSIYLPQRDGLLLRDLREAGENSTRASRTIFHADIAAIQTTDLLVAVLDGPSVDDGVCFELGYAYCLGKECVGLASDSRRAAGYFRNPMWDSALRECFSSTAELVEWAEGISDRWFEHEFRG